MRLLVIHSPGYKITDCLDAHLLPGYTLAARRAR
jgi:hypothetical protein